MVGVEWSVVQVSGFRFSCAPFGYASGQVSGLAALNSAAPRVKFQVSGFKFQV